MVVTELVSLIPNLEPLAGISLAVNLAYLNLQRWRYRQQVLSIAENGLKALTAAQDDDGSTIAALPQLRGLKVLAGQSSERKKLPVFIRLFDVVYGREWDVKTSGALSLFAVYILAVGVAHNIGVWQVLKYVGTAGWAHAYFYVLLFSLAFPLISVWLGRYLVDQSTEYAKDCFTELSSVYARKIADVQVPSASTTTHPSAMRAANPPAPSPARSNISRDQAHDFAARAAARLAAARRFDRDG